MFHLRFSLLLLSLRMIQGWVSTIPRAIKKNAMVPLRIKIARTPMLITND